MTDVDNNKRKVPVLWPNLKRIRAEPVSKDVAKAKVPKLTRTPKQNTNTKKRKRTATEQAEETQDSDVDIPSGAGTSINKAQDGNAEREERSSSLSPITSRFSALELRYENLKKNAVDKKAVPKKGEGKGKEKEETTENIDKDDKASTQQEKNTKETSTASVIMDQSSSSAADVDKQDNLTGLTASEEAKSESVFQSSLTCQREPRSVMAVAYSDYEAIQVQQDMLNEREQITDELDVRELLAIEATVEQDLQEEQVAELVMPLHKVQLKEKEPTQNTKIGTLPRSTKVDAQIPQQSAPIPTSDTEWDDFEAPSFSFMPTTTDHTTTTDDDITDLTLSEDEVEVITSADKPRAPVAIPQHKSEYIDLKPIPMVRIGDYYLVDIPDEILDLLEE